MSDLSRVVLVPWYEQEDFIRLRQMRNGAYLPPSYIAWRDQAVAKARAVLATGASAQVVRVNIDAYFHWLCERCVADTGEARLQYLHHLSSEAGCDVRDVCWPEPPKGTDKRHPDRIRPVTAGAIWQGSLRATAYSTLRNGHQNGVLA